MTGTVSPTSMHALPAGLPHEVRPCYRLEVLGPPLSEDVP
jgi:hypothetical protein